MNNVKSYAENFTLTAQQQQGDNPSIQLNWNVPVSDVDYGYTIYHKGSDGN